MPHQSDCHTSAFYLNNMNYKTFTRVYLQFTIAVAAYTMFKQLLQQPTLWWSACKCCVWSWCKQIMNKATARRSPMGGTPLWSEDRLWLHLIQDTIWAVIVRRPLKRQRAQKKGGASDQRGVPTIGLLLAVIPLMICSHQLTLYSKSKILQLTFSGADRELHRDCTCRFWLQ